MIMLTRLTGPVFALNSDLIERVDATPDTVITLVDGKKYLVQESVAEVVHAVRAYRGAIVAESAQVATGEHDRAAAPSTPSPEARHLAPVTPVGRVERRTDRHGED